MYSNKNMSGCLSDSRLVVVVRKAFEEVLFELSPNGTTGKQASVSRLGEWPLKLKESKIQKLQRD